MACCPFLLTDRKCQVQVPSPRKGFSPALVILSCHPACPLLDVLPASRPSQTASCLGWLPPQSPMQYPFLLAFLANPPWNGKEGQDLYPHPNSLRGPQATLFGLQSLPSTVSRPLAHSPSLAPPALSGPCRTLLPIPKCKENAGCDLAWSMEFGKPPPLPSSGLPMRGYLCGLLYFD